MDNIRHTAHDTDDNTGGAGFAGAIEGEIAVLRHLGYTDEAIARVVAIYSGYPAWEGLSVNQKRRLALDLKRHAGIAKRWHFALLNG